MAAYGFGGEGLEHWSPGSPVCHEQQAGIAGVQLWERVLFPMEHSSQCPRDTAWGCPQEKPGLLRSTELLLGGIPVPFW